MKTQNILIAGFGGQGVLFAGKYLAYTGLLRGKQLSWLPSYGPEMRGGTANCSVILSDEPVGSPIVSQPDCLIAMNLPSLEKFQSAVEPGGMIFLDSTLISDPPARRDITVYAVPASKLAADAGLDGLANMIMIGRFLKIRLPEEYEIAGEALAKVVPPQKAHLMDANRKAIEMGFAYEG